MPLEWTAAYDTGIEAIDADHRNLAGLLNLLERQIADGKADLGPVISALRSYVNTHFTREEALFVTDPCYTEAERDDHLRQHRAFRSEIQKMDARYRADPALVPPEELHAALRDWLVNHILKTDKDLGDRLCP